VHRFRIDFMGKRWVMFSISIALMAVSIGALAVRGLTFGVEFQGGTVINVADAGDVTIEEIRAAADATGAEQVGVQTTDVRGTQGYIIRTSETAPEAAAEDAAVIAEAVDLPESSFQVTTIGPGWGESVTNRAALALALSIVAILLYISVRFEYKMSLTAVAALVHDLTITLGIYALAGQEVTPNTVAALLTIMGYSLYDTIVVFHRIKENTARLTKQSFMQMANESINEVFVRSVNTTITSLIPVVVMLFFGGETLKDFAFALTVGLAVGAYSSIGVASPLYAMWKEREPKYRAMAKKYAASKA